MTTKIQVVAEHHVIGQFNFANVCQVRKYRITMPKRLWKEIEESILLGYRVCWHAYAINNRTVELVIYDPQHLWHTAHYMSIMGFLKGRGGYSIETITVDEKNQTLLGPHTVRLPKAKDFTYRKD